MVPVKRLLIKFIVRVSGFGISEKLLPGTWTLIFNNLVVLSRASWVYRGFQWLVVMTGREFRRSKRKNVLAKNRYRTVVPESVGVSPLELSRTSDG